MYCFQIENVIDAVAQNNPMCTFPISLSGYILNMWTLQPQHSVSCKLLSILNFPHFFQFITDLKLNLESRNSSRKIVKQSNYL